MLTHSDDIRASPCVQLNAGAGADTLSDTQEAQCNGGSRMSSLVCDAAFAGR